MKAILINFFLLTALLTFMSCSAGQKAVSLEVSSAALTSAGFTGGLIVSGVTADGKDSFVSTAPAGQNVTATIKNGTWVISATGWDGNSAFDGNVHCGQTTVNLDSNTTSINLTANLAGCNTQAFRSNTPGWTTAATGFQPLKIFSCGALYRNNNGVYVTDLETSSSTTLLAFCNSLPGHLKKTAKSGKMFIKGDGGQILTTGCKVTAGSSLAVNANVPADSTPMSFELFEETNCSGDSVVYDFKRGLITGESQIDSIVNRDTGYSSVNLILAFNDIKKGYSPFMNMLPSMKCSGSDCLPEPANPYDYYIGLNDGFREIEVSPTITSCLNETFSGAGLNFTNPQCNQRDGKVFVTVQTTATCQSASCVMTIINSATTATYTKTISANGNVGKERRIYEEVWKLFGTGSANAFFEIISHDNEKDGITGGVLEELSPGGGVSLFGKTECVDLAGVKEIEADDDGVMKKFQVIAENSTEAIPLMLCDSADANALVCPSGVENFTKKISMRAFEGNNWVTRHVLHVRCDKKIGYAESQQEKVESTESRSEKSIIGWNTQLESTKRVQSLEYELHKNGNITDRVQTSFKHAESTSATEYRGLSYEWEAYNQQNGSFEERLKQNDFFYTNSQYVSHYNREFSAPSTVPAQIFDQPLFSQAINRPFLVNDSFTAKSPDGTKQVRVWSQFENLNKKIYMSYYNATNDTWVHPVSLASGAMSNTTTGSDINMNPKAAIDNNGKIVLVWKEVNGGTTAIKMRYGTGGGSFGSIETLNSDNDNVGDIDVCMNGTRAAVVWDQTASTVPIVRAAYTSDVNSSWILPGTNDYLSETGVLSTSARCVISNSGQLILAYIGGGTTAKYTHGTILSSYTNLLMDMAANHIEESTAPGASEVYLEAAGSWVYATIVNRATNTTYIRKNNMTSLTSPWTDPYVGTNTNVRSQIDNASKNVTTAIGLTANAAVTAPNTLLTPPYSSLIKGNPYGLRELKLSTVLGKFTPYATFKNK